jgi:hypothetical protein
MILVYIRIIESEQKMFLDLIRAKFLENSVFDIQTLVDKKLRVFLKALFSLILESTNVKFWIYEVPNAKSTLESFA